MCEWERVNTAEEDGWTALMYATQNGHSDVVGLLDCWREEMRLIELHRLVSLH